MNRTVRTHNPLRDPSLSYCARGIYGSLPDGTVDLDDTLDGSHEPDLVIRAALDELVVADLITIEADE
jgi:hypothetical protein